MPDSKLSVTKMRSLDARLGRPLCSMLTPVVRRADRSASTGPIERILVLKLAEQGATVAALPALRRAIEMVGADNVYVAVFAENRFILDELGVIPKGNVLEVRTTSPTRLALDLLKLIRRARRLRIDSVVDLEFFSRVSALAAGLSGARRRSGLHSFAGEGSERGDLMTHRVSSNPTQHASHTFMALVEALEVPTDVLPAIDRGPWALEAPPISPAAANELTKVSRIVTKALGTDRLPPLILLNPNSGDLVPLRRWPADRYVGLAQALLDAHPHVAVLVTGSGDEAPAAEALAARIGSDRCVSVAGLTTMRELLVLYHLSEVLITNDSGPAHYASLTPIDVVVLFGPESPAIFGPVSPRSQHLWANLPCSPCVNAFNNRLSPCTNNLCMQRLSVDDVFGAVGSALGRRRSAAQPTE